MSLFSATSNNRNQLSVAKADAVEPVEKLSAFIKNLHGNADTAASKLTFDKKDPYQACLVSLYFSLLELTGAFLLLAESQSHVLIPSTIRSVLETYIEFENLRKDESYIRDMEFYHLGQEIRILENAKAGKSAFLVDIAKLSNLDEIIKEHKERRNRLLKKKAKFLQIKDRFIKAGFEEWYIGLYGFLSGNTHPSISSIFYRHFAREGDSISIVYGRNLPSERMLPHMDLTAGLLLDASKKTRALYGGESKDSFTEFEEQLTEIRKQYSDN